MGCTNTKDQVYVAKEPNFSNRDILEENDQLQAHHQQLQNYACGYQFSYRIQNAQTSSLPNQHEAKAEAERAKVAHFINICKQMKQKYMVSQIDEAFKLKEQVKRQYNEIDSNLIPQEWQERKEEMFVLMEQIEDKYRQINDFQQQLQHQNGIQQDSHQIYYSHHQNQVKISVSLQASIPLDLIVASFASFLRYSQFIKFSTESKQIKKLNNFRRLGEVLYDFPFCSKSNTYFQSIVFNRLNHNKSVLISYQSLYKNAKLCDQLQFFPIYEAEHKVDFSSIVCRVKQIDSNTTNISLLFKIKGEIDGVAQWIIEKMYKNMAVQTIKKLIERANAYGDETASESYEGDDQIYHYFHNLLKGDNGML